MKMVILKETIERVLSINIKGKKCDIVTINMTYQNTKVNRVET